MRIIHYFFLAILCLSLFSCGKGLTTGEKSVIHSADEHTPFRVLITTNKEDSVFLRQKNKDINLKKDKEDVSYLVKRMKETLEKEQGVGIAAPQIGIGRNIFLFMRIDKEGEPVEVAINPKIISHSEEMVCFERDGCLSIPDDWGNTTRYKWIEVEYQNENGEKIREHLKGHSRNDDFTGVIFQHEYDHLNGVLFIDKLCESNSQEE